MAVVNAVLSAALRRKVSLEADLKKINDFLSTYAELIGVDRTSLEQSYALETPEKTADHNPDPEGSAQPPPSSSQIDLAVPQQVITDAIFEALEEAARPLTSTELLNALHKRGIRIGGKEELKNLTTRLWRARDTFKKVGGRYVIGAAWDSADMPVASDPFRTEEDVEPT